MEQAHRPADEPASRPPRLIGFANETEPAPLRPRRPVIVWGGVIAAIGLVGLLGLAAILYELAALHRQLDRIEIASADLRTTVAADSGAATAAAAVRRAAHDRAAAREGSSAPGGAGLDAAERAFVTVDRIAVRRVTGRRGTFWTTAPIARNDGNTPTRDLRFVSIAGFAPPPVEAPLLLGSDRPAARFRRAAIAAHARIVLPGPPLLPRDRGRTLYLHGLLYYRDVLSQAQHVTQYCYYAPIPRHLDRGFAPSFRPCVHLNCNDRACYSGAGG